MQVFFNTLDNLLKWLLIFLMALMVVDVSWQVFSRFVLNAPSSYTEEIARFLLIWIGLLGASYAYKAKAHLGIDVLVKKFPPAAEKMAYVGMHIISGLFALIVMIGGGIRLVNLALELEQTSAALGIPMGHVYVVVPLSGLFILYYALRFIFTPASITEQELKGNL
ncbi:MAG: TRAP transporter small permease [Caldisericaceae bacterium]|nr:TRAP transporter small permease [Caldisericaceae bacterium]